MKSILIVKILSKFVEARCKGRNIADKFDIGSDMTNVVFTAEYLLRQESDVTAVQISKGYYVATSEYKLPEFFAAMASKSKVYANASLAVSKRVKPLFSIQDSVSIEELQEEWKSENNNETATFKVLGPKEIENIFLNYEDYGCEIPLKSIVNTAGIGFDQAGCLISNGEFIAMSAVVDEFDEMIMQLLEAETDISSDYYVTNPLYSDDELETLLKCMIRRQK